MTSRLLITFLLVAGLAFMGTAIFWLVMAPRGHVERTWSDEPLAPSDVLTELRTRRSPAATADVSSIPVPILTYHYVRVISPDDDPLGYRLSVPPGDFALQLEAFKHRGYEPITLKDFFAGRINERSIILTFDDGYRDFFEAAYPILRRRGVTAVAFVTTGFLNDKEGRYLTDEMVRELHDAGIEIGAHTVTHANLAAITPEKLRTELLESRFRLEELIGDRVTSVAYPSGKYSDDVLRLSAFAGYDLGVTTEYGAATLRDDVLRLPRINVTGGMPVDELLDKIDTAKRETTSRLSASPADG
ncbi:MAG: polysaccharide deacetylase family protein, partial [Patescibacteria group bacterium]